MKITALATALFGALLISSAAPAAAAVITFDNLPGDDSTIANGYSGLSWWDFSSVSNAYLPVAQGISTSGFDYSAVSGTNFATNDFGNPAEFWADKGTFNFKSAYFTSAYDANQAITVTGMLNGNALYSQTFSVTNTGPTLVTFDWAGINEVVVSPIDNGNGTVFGMDNLNISAVPLPSGLPLFGSAILGLLLVSRNRAREA